MAGLTLCGQAAAHPHIWIDASYELTLAEGKVTAIKASWTFDEFYTLYLIDAVKKDAQGQYDSAALQDLAATSVSELEAYGWFIEMRLGEKLVPGVKPTAYGYTVDGGRATLSFTLPLDQPADPRAQPFSFTGYDPSYYVDIQVGSRFDVTIKGDDACAVEVVHPQIEETTFAGMSEAEWNDPNRLQGAGALFAEQIKLTCG